MRIHKLVAVGALTGAAAVLSAGTASADTYYEPDIKPAAATAGPSATSHSIDSGHIEVFGPEHVTR